MGQEEASGLQSTHESAQTGHVRCMVLPSIYPTNIPKTNQPFSYWYNKVNEQYGSLRATLQTSDIVIAPLLATLSEPPYGGVPKYGVPEDWFMSISSLGITHACLSNATTLRASPASVIHRTNVLQQENMVPLGLFDENDGSGPHGEIIDIKGVRIALFSFVFPFQDYTGQFGMSGFDMDRFTSFYATQKDSIDCWIAIPSWKNGQYGEVSKEDQRALMQTLYRAGFDVVVGYSGKQMRIETMVHDTSRLLMFDVGTTLPSSVTQTGSGVLVEFSIDTVTKAIVKAGLIPIYPLLMDKVDEGEVELIAVFGRDMEVSTHLTTLTQGQEAHVKAFMAKFRRSKPDSVNEFYYPQSLSIRNDASHAVQLQKGWAVDSTIKSEPRGYGVQFLQLSREIMLDTIYYSHLKGYSVFKSNGRFHYVLGKNLTLEEAERLLDQLKEKSHEFAQIVQIKGINLITMTDSNQAE